jgi:glycosyltransferase involved in cell wall biosynthesis
MKKANKFIIGIDASRNRSGGAQAHIIGILNSFLKLGISQLEIHIWSYQTLLDKLPASNFIFKHHNQNLEKNILHQINWQYFKLPKEAATFNCDILLYTDAGAFINFFPCIVMSRDMLSFEAGEMDRYPFSVKKLRLIALKYIQAWSLKKATGSIFLTNYASNVIQDFTGELLNFKIIPHGVGDNFRQNNNKTELTLESNEIIKCIYVSNTAPYKHQWNVVEAISNLKLKGYNVELLLVGGGEGEAQQRLIDAMAKHDYNKDFIKQMEFVKHNEIPELLLKSDIFIFASSCENMPNTLIEGMASGLKIACSSRGPMPEVLKDGGYYFNPENPKSISNAIEKIIKSPIESKAKALKALNYSNNFSWDRCAMETFDFLKSTYQKEKLKNE